VLQEGVQLSSLVNLYLASGVVVEFVLEAELGSHYFLLPVPLELSSDVMGGRCSVIVVEEDVSNVQFLFVD